MSLLVRVGVLLRIKRDQNSEVVVLPATIEWFKRERFPSTRIRLPGDWRSSDRNQRSPGLAGNSAESGAPFWIGEAASNGALVATEPFGNRLPQGHHSGADPPLN